MYTNIDGDSNSDNLVFDAQVIDNKYIAAILINKGTGRMLF